MNAIYLEPAQVPQHLRSGYNGKKFKAVVCTSVTIPADAGLWGGGSRDTYRAVNLNTGHAISFPGQDLAPWGHGRAERVFNLSPGIAVVQSSIFCGKDMGLTFHVHPDNAALLLPAPVADLTPHQRLVLIATRSLKASYNGQDRYTMARGEHHCTQLLKVNGCLYPTRGEWDAAKAVLMQRGLLNRAGAITPAGRNAAK